MRTEFDAIERVAKQAGYEVMAEILGIVYNRESVDIERLLAVTPEDVNDLYDAFIGPAVDRIEKYLLENDSAYRCSACERPEGECSADPCPGVIADRGEQ